MQVVRGRGAAGSLPPGMSERLTVEFTPCAWDVHQDCVSIRTEVGARTRAAVKQGGRGCLGFTRNEVLPCNPCCVRLNLVSLPPLHTQEGALDVPLAGYPVMEAPSLPRRLDFGRLPLGAAEARSFVLTSHVPLAFDFEVRQLRPSPAFDVQPAAGTVPPNGRVVVEVTFRPTGEGACAARMGGGQHCQVCLLFVLCTTAGYGEQPRFITHPPPSLSLLRPGHRGHCAEPGDQ